MRHFSKEDVELARWHCKSKRPHITLVRKVITEKSANDKCWRGCGEKRTLLPPHTHSTGASVAWYTHCGEQYGGSFCAQLLSHVHLFATPWTVAYQAPLSMGFPRQEYWSGLPFLSPVDLPNPGIEPSSPALPGGFFTTGSPIELLG